ncbi:hypothetical protein Bpfe_026038 [Biomphalaria pfeifferi]|uniref:Uncharacterized protein n=1 Tax=Biomphalaria pfeifferi TaxID=112525 RepID=A0AAD8EYY2_BIOPF|nr:hypothetical protein Bpfe_026038 [Biomphalaria pfeifferi]
MALQISQCLKRSLTFALNVKRKESIESAESDKDKNQRGKAASALFELNEETDEEKERTTDGDVMRFEK